MTLKSLNTCLDEKRGLALWMRAKSRSEDGTSGRKMSGYFGGTWFGAYHPQAIVAEDEPTAVLTIPLSISTTEDTDPTATLSISVSMSATHGTLRIFDRLVTVRSPRNPPEETAAN